MELWLLEVFALRDLQICCGASSPTPAHHGVSRHDDHGARRLGAALRRLSSSPARLNELLCGLDATELMALAAPEEEPTSVQLRGMSLKEAESEDMGELSAMKLSALKRRAREKGVPVQQIEDADDTADVRNTVITLILGASK